MKQLLVVILACALSLSGCSVVMAAKQPGKKDLSLFSKGMPRSVIIAEFGEPVDVQKKDGKSVEVYKFVQGYSTGVKVGRSIFHAVADVFTLFLWEIAATPIEGMNEGDQVAYEVTFDAEQKVESVKVLKDGKSK
jgi:hypothetical protein